MCIENRSNYIIPFLFYYKHIFFFIKLYKSDEDFRDISSKILLLLSPLLSTIPSSHAEYSPFEGTFKNTFQLSIQLPLRKLTYSPLESFIPTSDIPHYLVPPVKKSPLTARVLLQRRCIKKKTPDKRIFNEPTYRIFSSFSPLDFSISFLSLSRIPLSSSSTTRTLKKVT